MVIIFPTDTVYGIGTSVYDNEGINKIYEIKNRDRNKKLAVLCANILQVREVAIMDKKAMALAKKFWPGALTLIVKSRLDDSTIAVRVPNHKLAIKILNNYGPMYTTSVNDSGSDPINVYEEIVNKYDGMVDKIYDNNEEIIGISSTIIDTTNNFKILRLGSINEEEIKKVIENV